MLLVEIKMNISDKFNLENVHKYCHKSIDIIPEKNREIDGSYEEICSRLFPNL